MENELYKKIELVFRNSNSPDELFDRFTDAIKLKISDISLYKILLANPALSIDEIKMFTGKLLKEIPHEQFQLSMWAAKIFENRQTGYEFIDNSIHYYEIAMQSNPTSHEPLLEMLKLYNVDIELPHNKKILEMIDTYIPSVNFKSKIYFSLAELYKKLSDLNKATKYLALANKAAERERDNQ